MNIRIIMAALVLGLVGLVPAAVHAQSCTSTSVTENFTGATTNCSWNFYGGACLTAGSTTFGSTSSPGQLPMCKNLPYYGAQTQVGGNTGDANQDTPATGGALRLTNSGNNQSGAIVSNVPFSLSSAGLQVTFTTETYIGDSGSNSHGGGSDGARAARPLGRLRPGRPQRADRVRWVSGQAVWADAVCTSSVSLASTSGSVCGRTPWPRLKM